MFLIVVGATTASTLDFIGSYSLAVIILFPVLFLVVIPYISSKIVTGVPRVVRRLRKKRTAIRTYESPESRDMHAEEAVAVPEDYEHRESVTDSEDDNPSDETDDAHATE